MPVKFVSCCKRRNVRAIIVILFLVTLIFTIYQLLWGNASETGPTFLETNHIHHSLNHEEINDNNEGVLVTQRTSTPRQNSDTLIPRYNKGFSANKYEKERENGRCPKIQIFKPDIDVTAIYQDLEFDANWIQSKEYWNPFFENRYKAIKKSKQTPPMKVFVIPHSHNDPGWLKTFEEYYTLQTRHVLDNAVEKMTELKNMTFLWSEISFLSKWWLDAHPRKRTLLKNLVKEGRLEIVTGGWVMTDEATVNLYSMIDQLIEGQQWVKMHLDAVPTSSWSVDPFGHGSTLPYILNKAGINGMVIQRIHYGWKKWFMVAQSSDFKWVQRWDYANKHSISTHNAPFDIYSIKHSCGPHPHICLNFDFKSIAGEYSENSMIMQPITKSNVKEKAELMLEQYAKTASVTGTHNMAMISMGDDFRFTNIEEWDQQYSNYMKLFHYINSRKDRYNAEVGFGTVADYFKALSERQYKFPTFSGDFHVYSDIFSDGRPAYWSGYYGTRPFWKKFYRETENNLRGAEIVYTFANILANQKRLHHSQQVLGRSYEDLTIARRWLALFAHHDATTGTSKEATMNDYGNKLFEAFQLSKKVQMDSIETILYGKADGGILGTDIEIDGFGSQPRQIPVSFENSSSGSMNQKVVIYNNLARHRYQIVTLVVSNPNIEVLGPNGEFIQAQLNPVVDKSSGSMVLSGDVFELCFFASLAPLSLSVFQLRESTSLGEHNAVRAQVYCKGCKSLHKVFEINEIQTGDIQLNNDRMTVLFDRNSGMIMSITKIKEDVSVSIGMKFGSYSSVNFRSGAYLLKPDVQSEQEIPFQNVQANLIIISGPISSELSVFSEPLLLSSKIMHVGDDRMLEAVYIQNKIDLKDHNGEIYMRFDTDLNSVSKVKVRSKPNDAKQQATEQNQEEAREEYNHQPTFYTDQAGFTVEKRVKVEIINYEGNSYPVNTMAFVQDDARRLRFSILVDRSHGFSSMIPGRLEALVERRTVYDDGRGMGEGVVDNRPTISNYIILFEKFGSNDKVRHAEHDYRNYQPTLSAHHHSQELSYPAFTYLVNNNQNNATNNNNNENGGVEIFPLLTQEIPCDSHLINLRTVTDTGFNPDLNFPSRNKALLIVQKLGYLCTNNNAIDGEKPGCGNPNPMSLFYPKTKFNGIKLQYMSSSSLAGVEEEKSHEGKILNLHDITAEPFEIRTLSCYFY